MRPMAILCVAAALSGAALSCAAQVAGDAAKGAELFEDRCAFCHVAQGGGQGPSLAAVHGRKAASLAGYTYSAALKASGIVWTGANLDRFLAGPGRLVPGTAMLLALPDSGQRADVVAYLTGH